MIRRIVRVPLLLSLLVPVSAFPSEELRPQRHVVAVLDFAEQGEIPPGSGQVAAELLEIALVKTGRFELVERGRLENVTSELELGMTGLVSGETAQKIGEIVGAEVIITGSVYRLEGVTGMNTRLVATRDASIITADGAQSRTKTTLNALVDEILPLIIKNFPLRGYVIERTGDEAVIDLGANVGMIVGREFKAYVAGKELRSTVTNEILHREEIDKGLLEVIEVNSLTARCRIKEENPAGSITRGDLIKSIGFEVEGARPAPAKSPAVASPSPAAGTWKSVAGAPTVLMTLVDNQPGNEADAFSDSLRNTVADELAGQGVATPVLTELPGDQDEDDLTIPPEYAADKPYLLRLRLKEYVFESDGDAEVEVVCRVYDPATEDLVFRKGFSFEPSGDEYTDREELLGRIRAEIASEIADMLRNRLR